MANKKLFYPVPRWKYVVGIILALIFLHGMLYLYSSLIRLGSSGHQSDASDEQIKAIKADRVLPTSLDKLPRVALKVDHQEQAEVAKFYASPERNQPEAIKQAIADKQLPSWYPHGQSPVLAELEKAGKLPPVAERVGPEPIVMRGCDGIGTYGGTWLRIANSPDDVSVITWRLSASNLARFSPLGDPVVAHVAKTFVPQNGGREWIVTLRKIRWSDGAPVTTDDISYSWFDERLDPTIGGYRLSKLLYVGGKPAKLEVLDKHRLKYTFAHPYMLFPQVLTRMGVTPSHYMRKYHPALGDQELIKRDMEAYGLATPRALYRYVSNWKNPDCPRLWPWIYRKHKTTSPQVFVRNPYYYAVDEQGNQLPYIDRIQFEVMDNKMLAIAAANGRISMQNRYIRFENYTDIMGRSSASNIRMLHWVPGTRSEWIIHPNQNRSVPNDSPDIAWKAKLLAKKEFRQALSLAIDRKKIIGALYHGITKPQQVDPGPLSPFHSPKLANAFINYDPEQANAMLDDVWRSLGADPELRNQGFRATPDGKPLTFYLDFCEFTGMGPAQFVVNDWTKVGIRCIFRQRARNLFYTEKAWRNFDFNIWSSESETLPFLSPRCFVAENSESNFAIGWGIWFDLGGLYGSEESKRNGAVEPPLGSPMRRAMVLFEQARMAPTEAEIQTKMNKVLDIAAENLWTINICEAPPALVVCNADIRNVPSKAMVGACLMTPGNTGIETYFFAHPDQAGQADAVDQLQNPVPLPRETSAASSGGSAILSYLILAIVLLFLGMLCLRHPFVLRRLLIMVPTLLVISICVFTIIQLPPGDFLSSKIMQLQETGSPPEIVEQEIRTLRSLFHFDEPAPKRYLRWMGVYWFFSFKAEDKGLLQGNMGRSMATSRSVNSMVGDRILLTFLISLGTVLFTWALAIPIGIFSACRQYSIGDYVFTILGFLGMCLPSFLLALILMALTNVSGLFSAEYAVQPFWSWGKFFDLLKHIWIPVLVMGVSGTAGMIRVMRANLLDELRKPYVTTARAKGVRPLKLLIKYPVRMALNPFISGIGGLFPQLVSGSSLVAIVMSLPTVGPLMLSALFSQDMNMAGSMLMVLSLLGVFGTLVSDMLLLWADPRIRLGGGGR